VSTVAAASPQPDTPVAPAAAPPRAPGEATLARLLARLSVRTLRRLKRDHRTPASGPTKAALVDKLAARLAKALRRREAAFAFCPTGPGGGVDPTCGKGGGKGAAGRKAKAAPHPLAGKSDDEARAALTPLNHHTAPPDPWGLAGGAVTSADPAALTRTVGAALARVGGFDRATVPGLYDAAKAAHPGLTLLDFQRQLVHLMRAGKVTLHAWTQRLADLPRPQLAIPLDREIKYYVAAGRAAFAAEAPLSFTPWAQEACV
jgi:hypothetical protein